MPIAIIELSVSVKRENVLFHRNLQEVYVSAPSFSPCSLLAAGGL
jgi:hypothetical protein